MSTQTIINKKSQFYVRGGYIIVNTVLKNQYFYPGGNRGQLLWKANALLDYIKAKSEKKNLSALLRI